MIDWKRLFLSAGWVVFILLQPFFVISCLVTYTSPNPFSIAGIVLSLAFAGVSWVSTAIYFAEGCPSIKGILAQNFPAADEKEDVPPKLGGWR